jgi:hypothetical protein
MLTTFATVVSLAARSVAYHKALEINRMLNYPEGLESFLKESRRSAFDGFVELFPDTDDEVALWARCVTTVNLKGSLDAW